MSLLLFSVSYHTTGEGNVKTVCRLLCICRERSYEHGDIESFAIEVILEFRLDSADSASILLFWICSAISSMWGQR